MTELELFEYFKKNQLHSVDFELGTINTKVTHYTGKSQRIQKDIGSLNEDGYVRVWCGIKKNKRLKMRSRLMFYLYHGYIPNGEIDHKDRNRSNDSIHNLRDLSREENCKNTQHTIRRGAYSNDVVLQVCQLLQDTDYSDLTISKIVGISRNYVRDIKKRRRRSSLSTSFHWPHRE